MRRPSKRSILIGSGFFVIGFIAATTLSYALVARAYKRMFVPAIESWSMVSQLVDSNQLLRVVDQRPTQLAAIIVSDAQSRSLAAANNFDYLSKDHQRIVLRQLTMLDRSEALRADDGPRGRTAHLARLMVLCSHASARPGWMDFGNESGMTMDVPEWVMDPEAKPVMPTAGSIFAGAMQSSDVIAAERKKWTALHQWVIDNRGCITAHEQAS